MAKTILIKDGWVWVQGIDEYVSDSRVKYKLTYSNNSEFTCSPKVPQYIIDSIKNILKGAI